MLHGVMHRLLRGCTRRIANLPNEVVACRARVSKRKRPQSGGSRCGVELPHGPS